MRKMQVNDDNATLYKYRAYNAWALEILIRRELYFAEPRNLNDPYDCRINIKESLDNAIASARDSGNSLLHGRLERFLKIEHVYEKMDTDLGKLGVLSLTKNYNEVLMWSHYSENHSGFCIGFKLSEKFTTYNIDDQIIGATEVSYLEDNPFANYFEELVANGYQPEWDEFWKSLLSMGMVVKAKSWEYEDEVRVLRTSPGTVTFDPTELTEIVFGLSMPNQRRETIRKILSGSEWDHVQFKEIIRTNDFKLLVKNAI